jgi:hypothetical protein
LMQTWLEMMANKKKQKRPGSSASRKGLVPRLPRKKKRPKDFG